LKVAIVSCFDTYGRRIEMLRQWFMSKGCDVTVYESDFRHFEKVKRTDGGEGRVLVKTIPYYKNISIKRAVSHHFMAKEALRLVAKTQPDLLYVLVPSNSLAKYACIYKNKYPRTKLCIDVVDLWPETLPSGGDKKHFPFQLWRGMRDGAIKAADTVITECSMYKEVLGSALTGKDANVLYLAGNDSKCEIVPPSDDGRLHLCYLGSINSLIDIQMISSLIMAFTALKPTVLHVIGDGEAKRSLLGTAESSGACVEFHGKIFDDARKKQVFDLCSFGLNVMKESVCVGLTMKSIDYFEAGLPVINTIKGDTWDLVKQRGIGLNVRQKSIPQAAQFITSVSAEKVTSIKQATRKVYEDLFSGAAFSRKMEEIFGELFK
jgi:glycosyltransferase involved in cell wall biosynthesis